MANKYNCDAIMQYAENIIDQDDAGAYDHDRALILRLAFSELSSKDRDMLHDVYMEHMPYSQVSVKYKMPLTTAHARCRSAVKRLFKMLRSIVIR